MKGGHALVKAIEIINAGMAGVPGSEFAPILDEAGLNFIQTNSEATAAGIAIGLNEVGKLAVVMTTKAPGTLNGATPVKSAQDYFFPMIYLATGANYEMFNDQQAWQNIDPKVFQTITKEIIVAAPYKDGGYNETDLRLHEHYTSAKTPPMNIVEAFVEAVKVAQSGFKGPVYLGVPRDVLLQEFPDDYEFPDLSDFKPTKHIQNAEFEEDLYQRLREAKKPVFIVGNAATHLIDKEVTELAKKSGATIVGTFMHMEQRPDNHNYVGNMDFVRRQELEKMVVEEADLIVYIGSKGAQKEIFDYNGGMHLTEGAEEEIVYNNTKKIVAVTPEPFYGGKRFDPSLNVFGNMSEILTRLEKRDYEITEEKGSWVKENHLAYLDHLNRDFETVGDLNVQLAMRSMSEYLPENTDVVFATMAGFTYAADVRVDKGKNQRVHGATEAMGYHIGRAIGIAETGKKVVLAIGDGGALMNGQLGELKVAAERGLDITVVVFNNQAHGAILGNVAKQFESGDLNEKAGPGVLHTQPVDFTKLGESVGANETYVLKLHENADNIFERVFSGKGVKVVQMNYSPLASVRGVSINATNVTDKMLGENKFAGIEY